MKKKFQKKLEHFVLFKFKNNNFWHFKTNVPKLSMSATFLCSTCKE